MYFCDIYLSNKTHKPNLNINWFIGCKIKVSADARPSEEEEEEELLQLDVLHQDIRKGTKPLLYTTAIWWSDDALAASRTVFTEARNKVNNQRNMFKSL